MTVEHARRCLAALLEAIAARHGTDEAAALALDARARTELPEPEEMATPGACHRMAAYLQADELLVRSRG